MLYNGMYRIDDKLAVVPDIASALPEQSADGLTWHDRSLRDDVKWHDGTPVTADDVKFTYDLAPLTELHLHPRHRARRSATTSRASRSSTRRRSSSSSSRSSRRSSSARRHPSMPKAAVTASTRQVRGHRETPVDEAAVAALADTDQDRDQRRRLLGRDPAGRVPGLSTYTAEVEPLTAAAASRRLTRTPTRSTARSTPTPTDRRSSISSTTSTPL